MYVFLHCSCAHAKVHTAIPGSLLTLILEICTGNILIFLLLGRFSLLQFKLAYKVPFSVCYRTRACTYSEMIQCQFKVMPGNFLILKTCVWATRLPNCVKNESQHRFVMDLPSNIRKTYLYQNSLILFHWNQILLLPVKISRFPESVYILQVHCSVVI